MQKQLHEIRVLIARFRDFEVEMFEKIGAILAHIDRLLPTSTSSRDLSRLPGLPHPRNIPPMVGALSAAPSGFANESYLPPLIVPPSGGNYGPSVRVHVKVVIMNNHNNNFSQHSRIALCPPGLHETHTTSYAIIAAPFQYHCRDWDP